MYLDHPGIQPIRHLLEDPEVTEIMVNGPARVYAERGGVMAAESVALDDRSLERLIGGLLQPSGRSVSASSPYVDFRLPDGSRGNVIIPPLAVDGPAVTIRKFTRSLATVADLLKVGTLSRRMGHLLAAAVKGRANILFAGATGTGKTTTLNILSRHIPQGERIITIEDTAELSLQQDHVVRLECRPANIEGKGAVTLAHLLRNALRMRPTRIIVGEVRGAEALEMLQAIASGHQGCLAVLHASSPVDAVSRLEMMALARGLMLPLWAIHRQIDGAVDLIVQHEIRPDGSRRITHVTQCAGVADERVRLQDLFTYRRTGTDEAGRERGQWVATGTRPRFLDRLEKQGLTIPSDVWAEGADAPEA